MFKLFVSRKPDSSCKEEIRTSCGLIDQGASGVERFHCQRSCSKHAVRPQPYTHLTMVPSALVLFTLSEVGLFTSTDGAFSCVGKNASLHYEDPQSCLHFFQCPPGHSEGIRQTCAYTTAWDSSVNTCTQAPYDACKQHMAELQVSTATSRTPTLGPSREPTPTTTVSTTTELQTSTTQQQATNSCDFARYQASYFRRHKLKKMASPAALGLNSSQAISAPDCGRICQHYLSCAGFNFRPKSSSQSGAIGTVCEVILTESLSCPESSQDFSYYESFCHPLQGCNS